RQVLDHPVVAQGRVPGRLPVGELVRQDVVEVVAAAQPGRPPVEERHGLGDLILGGAGVPQQVLDPAGLLVVRADPGAGQADHRGHALGYGGGQRPHPTAPAAPEQGRGRPPRASAPASDTLEGRDAAPPATAMRGRPWSGWRRRPAARGARSSTTSRPSWSCSWPCWSRTRSVRPPAGGPARSPTPSAAWPPRTPTGPPSWSSSPVAAAPTPP